MQDSDIYVASGLLAAPGSWTFRSLAEHLQVPVPLVQRALKRLGDADLYNPKRRQLHAPNFEEFALHGLRFVVPARLGPVVPGVPAAWGVPPVSTQIRAGGELPPVWPHPLGMAKGHALEPLHKAAPDAVQWFARLGEVLSVMDSLRFQDRRIRSVASKLMIEIARTYAASLR